LIFREIPKKSENICNVRIRCQKKSGGTGDGRIERNGTVLTRDPAEHLFDWASEETQCKLRWLSIQYLFPRPFVNSVALTSNGGVDIEAVNTTASVIRASCSFLRFASPTFPTWTCRPDMGLAYLDALAVLVALLGLLVIHHVNYKRSMAPLPPGPKKLPLLGNLFNVPRTDPHMAYRNWSRQFGTTILVISLPLETLMCSLGSDIIHLAIPGQNIIVLDSATAAIDLLEKKSSIYSSR